MAAVPVADAVPVALDIPVLPVEPHPLVRGISDNDLDEFVLTPVPRREPNTALRICPFTHAYFLDLSVPPPHQIFGKKCQFAIVSLALTLV